MSKHIIAVDIGTSSCRAIIFDEHGNNESFHQEKYSIEMPQPHWQEQCPNKILLGVIKAIKECLKNSKLPINEILGLVLSSQMYSVFPIDKEGTPLMNSIIWADSRSEEAANSLISSHGSKYFYEKTGCPINSIYPLSKIHWINRNQPEIFRKTFKFISIKEYVIHKLTGKYLIDYSCASATGIFNIFNHQWDQTVLYALGISESMLSETVDSVSILELNNPEISIELSLPIGFPLIIGAGDGPLANLGSGATQTGDINIDLGTSGAARTLISKPVIEPNNKLWCYCLTKQHWVLGGILNNVGNLYKWFNDNIAFYGQPNNGEDIWRLNEYAQNSPIGSKGLYFLPFLLKARSPYWDTNLKSLIFGLRPEHNIQDITRSMIEGVTYNLYHIIEAITNNIPKVNHIYFTGGLSLSEIWAQTICDVLGKDLILPVTKEGSAGGAAILGMYALGIKTKMQFTDKNQTYKIYKPNNDYHKEYQKHISNNLEICRMVSELSKKLNI